MTNDSEDLLLDTRSLVDPFTKAERPDPATHLVGTELEKFGVVVPSDPRAPLSTVTYVDHIAPVLDALVAQYGWERGPDRGVNGETIELRRDNASITLEPGGQFELSGKPNPDLHATCAEFTQHYRELHEVSQPLRLAWMTAGFHPWATREEIAWMPKGRYAVMRAYLPTRGDRALDMMLRTCTVQANFDYTSEDQCGRRVRLAALMAPVVLAMFAHSPYREGTMPGMATLRGYTWLAVDPDRCGIPAFMLDGTFSYQRYVDWLLDVPMFFVKRAGVYHHHHVPFRKFMAEGFTTPDGVHHRATANDWMLHGTTVFPEVRLKPFIEVRSADAVGSRYLCGVPAFLKGLLYDEDALAEAVELLAGPDLAGQAARRDAAIARGMRDPELASLARDLLALARRALERTDVRDSKGRTEARFLDPLDELAARGWSPGDEVAARVGAAAGRTPEGQRAFVRAYHFAGFEIPE